MANFHKFILNSLCIQIIFGLSTTWSIELSNKEIEALEKFKPIANEIIDKDYMRTDRVLINYLRAKDLNLDKAADMLRKTMKWRKENKIDQIMEEDMSFFDTNIRAVQSGTDKKGRPVWILQLGSYDVRKYVLSGKLAPFLRYLDRQFELGEYDLRRRNNEPGGENVDGVYFILDMRGFNLKTQACVLCLTALPHLFQTPEVYYPGFLKRIVLVNTPNLFLPNLDLIRPVMSKRTSEALSIYGFNQEEWKSALRKDIDPDQLPILYGGTLNINPRTYDWKVERPEIAQFIKFHSSNRTSSSQ